MASYGSDEAIDAYRKLPAAVAKLDHLAGLRIQMAQVANIGPHARPVACLVTNVDQQHPLTTAESVWRGVVEPVQFNIPPYNAPLRTQLRRPRLGGPWLELLAHGFELGINTADEADAIVRHDAEVGADS